MDFLTPVLLLPSLVWILFHFLGIINSNLCTKSPNLPPGPSPLPIIGNLLQLGRNPSLTLLNLSKTYGPIVHLKLGNRTTIVVSSPEMAQQILQAHDQTCSGRVVPHAAQALNHHEASIAWLPVGNKWRTFRKICKEHMFTQQKLEATQALRWQKLKQLRDYLEKCCGSGRVVNIGEAAFVTTLNLISATLFSIDFASFESTAAQEVKEMINGIAKVTLTPNVADYFPILRLIDPQGLKRKREVYIGKLLEIFEGIIRERLRLRGKCSDNSWRKNDLLDVLLDINEEDGSDFSHNDTRNIILDLILAGTHTTTNSVQWAMAELIHNPEKMLKAKNELKTVIGENKQVEEFDIPKLPYLCAVIKENLRCHPAGPFLLPHKAEADVNIAGYMIPNNAQILVNIWAIGRDSRIWPNPNSFEPERFLDAKTDYKGQDFELIPFGSGRRICPGMPLAHLMLHLMVASFIHNFDWKLEGGSKFDMTEIAFHKTLPLRAYPLKRRIARQTSSVK